MNDAGSLDAAKIRDGIKALNEPMTPFGPVHFEASGQNQHPVLITQVQGGQYKVVFPTDAADAKPIIPAPKWSERK